MVKTTKFWKATGIYLIILNFILLVVFSGFIIDKKISKNKFENKMFEVEYNNYEIDSKDIIIGNENASLTLVVYNDYDSPYCRKFDDKSYTRLKKEYVDTGLVNIVIKDFIQSDVHKNSIIAAQAVKCAEDQNMAERMHEVILDNKNPNETNLNIWAQDLNLNNSQFSNCLDSEKYLPDVIENVEDAQENEVKVVPTFFVDDKKLEGVQPYFVIKKVIDSELAELN